MAEKVFSGGDVLKQRLAEIAKGLGSGVKVRAGFLEGAAYPDGTSVPMVAAIHEFGAPRAGIPPRPFMRVVVANKSNTWADAVAANLKANDYDAAKAMQAVGIGIEGQIQDQIVATDSPALSPVTLMLRKMKSEDQSLVVTGKTVGEAAARVAAGESTSGVNSKVLNETGHMLKSISSEVVPL